MMDFLKNWAVNIVILTVFVALLEIILPSSTMKKYIRVIIGFLIIIVIINPFIKLFDNYIKIEKEVFANLTKGGEFDKKTKSSFISENNERILKLYKQNLKRSIEETLRKRTKYITEVIEIDIIENRKKENYGYIREIKLLVKEKNNEPYVDKNDNHIKVNQIDEVKISIGDSKKSNKKADEVKLNSILNVLTDSYSIPKEKIYIYMSDE
ncbi:Stage III sporulation protein AF [Caldisalinibacter kiritimatiensis]|uniref:Stage III sporulation protein AF n=2 Tax=Caldisalinibacter kiritimatiensis TaxID=1304284 RepID=R1CM29_9FIRM|nr:Stage III sporulation protein AF [Caldisalinibacter kiritimatiensis]